MSAEDLLFPFAVPIQSMPIYDYSCRACGHGFEKLIRGTTIPSCPACNSQDLERKFSLPAVRSEASHDLAMRAAKRRDGKQAAEAAYTQREYENNHDSD